MKHHIFLAFLTFFATFGGSSQVLQNNIKFLALGDSYTIGQSVSATDRWPNQFIDSLSNLDYSIEKNDIIATTGWTTSNLLNAMNNTSLEKDYNLISILIGVNNFYQGRPVNLFRTELPAVIDSALTFCNNDTNAIFLVTIPDYGYTPFGAFSQNSISNSTDLYNGIKDSVAAVYGIPVYNITDISRRGIDEPDLVAGDNLHPSGKQYKEWVDLIISEMLSTTSISQPANNVLMTWKQEQTTFIKTTQSGSLTVYDLSGKLIKTAELQQNDTLEITTKGLAILKFSVQGKTYSLKIN